MDTLIATEKHVPLAPFTTLGIGGSASEFVRVKSARHAMEVLRWWSSEPELSRPKLFPLGGGSNLLVSDLGFQGLVLKMENRDVEIVREHKDRIEIRVGAGEVWDDFVALACRKNWSGVECLSGIPGSVGASPVQNIGAYGQEVSETIVSVEGIDISNCSPFKYSNKDCAFSYRDSLFKRAEPGRYLITDVTFCLVPGGTPSMRYHDLQARCQARSVESLSELRELVLEIRRTKSMVYDPLDPNHRSAGSFFTNPIVTTAQAEEIQNSLPTGSSFPRFEAGSGFEKLSAAWLIDNAGLNKGFRLKQDARVGLSSNHVLALVNLGEAKASELLELCEHVQGVVKDRFNVTLVPEPVFLGFD